MGDWAIIITGAGSHDSGQANDADAIYAELLDQLRARGQSVTTSWFCSSTGAKSGDAIAPAAITALPTAAAVAPAAALVETNDVADTSAAPDDSQPFKCPACGATYSEQVACTNQHPAEPTLPTADVLAGAEATVTASTDSPTDTTTPEPAAATDAAAGGGDTVPPIPTPPAWPA